MSARAFLTTITIIVSVMAVAALLETAVPFFAAKTRSPGRRAANLGLTAIVFVLNWLLASLAAIAALGLSIRSAPGLLSMPFMRAKSATAENRSTSSIPPAGVASQR